MKASIRSTCGLAVALVTSFSIFAAAQQPAATTPKERREDRQEKREDRQEKREERQEKREDAKEQREDAKERKEDKAEAKEEAKEERQEKREERKAKRQERVKEIRAKWGDMVSRPPVRNELRNHAQRMARLNRARKVAEEAQKTEMVTRIDKLMEREKTRHQAAMDRLKTEGAKP
jgi:hypothetical protein